QEQILPNVAYLGGPAEVAYWLQLKTVFQHYQTPFPLILPRNFVMVLDHNVQRKVEALGLTDQEIFTDIDLWKKECVIKNTGKDITLKAEKEQLVQVFDQISGKALQSDPTLEYAAEAAKSRAIKIVDQLSVKLRKAEERKEIGRAHV